MRAVEGLSALVTGASRGVGAAVARELAMAGIPVVLAARNVGECAALTERIREAGGKAASVACDVTDYSAVEAAVAHCREQFGGPDILINNAGVIEPIGRIGTVAPDAWGRGVDVNLKGVLHGLRAVLPHMEAAGAGIVINISSGAATSVLEGWSQYCASKAGVLSLTRAAHLEYGDRGICVLGLSPGTVATGMQQTIRASGINPVSQLDPSAHIPASDVGKAVLWLVREGAAEFAGTDFSLKTAEGRMRAGLAPN